MGFDAEHRQLVMLQVVPVPAFADNYLWLVHDDGSGETAVVDPGAPEMRVVSGDTLTRIRRTCKAAGILQISPPEARAHLVAGVNFVAVASDAFILARQSEAVRADLTARA